MGWGWHERGPARYQWQTGLDKIPRQTPDGRDTMTPGWRDGNRWCQAQRYKHGRQRDPAPQSGESACKDPS